MDSDLIRAGDIKKLNETMALCERVDETVATKGWVEIIEPLIDKMITDITGCKMKSGRYHSGLLNRARKDERREYYVGYKQALIDLHMRVYAYVDSIPRLKDQREQIVLSQSKKSSVPLVDDTRYGRDMRAV